MANEQIAVSGSPGSFGIQATTVKWGTGGRAGYTTAGTLGGTIYLLTVFTQVQKTPQADLAPSEDNTGERLGDNRRNKRIQMRFSAHPKGSGDPAHATPALIASARLVAANLPNIGDPVLIICANDTQIACDGTTDTCLVDDCSSSETPEGELVVDFTVTKWIGKVFIAAS